MKKACFALLITILLLCIPAFALAADVSVSADATSVQAGDEVTVTIVVSAGGIAAAEGAFTYDPAVLTFVSASGGASDGILSMVSAEKNGSDSLTAVIDFVAAAPGETTIDVAVENAYDYSNAPLGSASAAVAIAVSGTDTPPEDGGSPPAAVDVSKTGIPAENVEGAENPMYVWRSLTSLTLPGGYADRQVEYHGEFVGGAAVPDTEYPVLLYLSEADGANGAYYVYEAERGLLYRYYTLTSVRAVYTIMEPETGMSVPDGFSETILTTGEKNIPAWRHEGGDGSQYLVYAKDPSGNKNFYLYDPEEESMQRYVPLLSPEPETAPVSAQAQASAPQNDSADKTVSMLWFVVVCALCVILLIGLICVLVSFNSYKKRQTSRRRPRDMDTRQ